MIADAVADALRPWTYYFGLPDRSGAARYTHLVRWNGDPPETKARGGGLRPAGWQKRLGGAEEWAAEIDALLADGRPRTFNAIAVQLTGTTADVVVDEAPDQGLWLLVERGRVAWACEERAVFFLRADFVALEAA